MLDIEKQQSFDIGFRISHLRRPHNYRRPHCWSNIAGYISNTGDQNSGLPAWVCSELIPIAKDFLRGKA